MWKPKTAMFIFFCLLMAVLPSFCVFAAEKPYFYFGVQEKPYCGGDLVKLEILANKTEKSAAGFRVQVDYDDTRFHFLRTETSDQIKSKTLRVAEESNPICGVYVCNTDQNAAPRLSGTIITFVFEVNEGAAAGTSQLRICTDQICHWDLSKSDGECTQDFTLNILPQSSNTASLASLRPSAGTLKPAFSSECMEYELDVPSETQSVVFTADAEDDGRVKTNRKTLGRAGTTTSIITTVTSANGKNHAKYFINVNRAEKVTDVVKLKSAFLTKLVPFKGELSPCFSSELTQYELNVDASVNEITFDTAAADGGTVKTSRKKLSKAGESTEIAITVTSSDKKDKLVYNVTVHRADVGSEPTQETKNPLLSVLEPSEGELTPPFSPTKTEYKLRVGAQVKEVTFQAFAANSGTVKVSRRTLRQAGESTNISITVTSADHKSKQIYTIIVDRVKEEESYVPKTTGIKSSVKSKRKQKATSVSQAAAELEPMRTNTPLQGETRSLYVTGNQMPAYLTGMLSTLGCISLGAFLMWMKAQMDNKKK